MKWVHDRIYFKGFMVPSEGRGGGMASLWKAGANVWVDSFLKYHIDSIVNGVRKMRGG